MKTMKKIMIVLFGLLALASCSNDDDEQSTVQPATEEQLHFITDHWYAEIPISGETANWRTEEEGDMTTFDKVGVLIYLNGYYTEDSYWGFIYMKDGDLVNFDGINRMTEDASFDYTMDSEGHITPHSQMENVPQVSNMHYDSTKDIITADATYNGHTLTNIVFTRPTEEQEVFLDSFWEMLVEAGMIGYDDGGYEQKTDVTDEDATESSRARELNIEE